MSEKYRDQRAAKVGMMQAFCAIKLQIFELIFKIGNNKGFVYILPDKRNSGTKQGEYVNHVLGVQTKETG